jgi:hypothetical protein
MPIQWRELVGGGLIGLWRTGFAFCLYERRANRDLNDERVLGERDSSKLSSKEADQKQIGPANLDPNRRPGP